VKGLGGLGHTFTCPPANSIMLSNEVFALACRAWYGEQGLVVDKTNGQFAHCPQPERYGDKGYYLLWGHHQHQGLLQSRDIGECCFFLGDAKNWLRDCDYFPEGYFELWDIYDEYSGDNLKKAHAEKNENGKSIHGVKSAKKLNKEKNKNRKSVNAQKGGKMGNKEGKRKNGKKLHEEKNEQGKSLHGVKNAEKVNSKKNEYGKSVAGVKGAETTNSRKNKDGKCVAGVKGAEKLHAQKWVSTMDGFSSTAGAVARHNKARGWDPAARVRIK
jgi:hypothetical protein